jgi:hypothetical protein
LDPSLEGGGGGEGVWERENSLIWSIRPSRPPHKFF